jgi:hypothetical protein
VAQGWGQGADENPRRAETDDGVAPGEQISQMGAEIAENRVGITHTRRVSMNLGTWQGRRQTPGEGVTLPGQGQKNHAFGE